jgi:DNA-binding CsgD family transcriptional regulator
MSSLSRYDEKEACCAAPVSNLNGRQTSVVRSPPPTWRDAGLDERATRAQWSVLDMLDRIGCGYLILNHQGSVIGWNAVAQTKLEGIVEPLDDEDLAIAFRRLVAKLPARFPPGSLSWVVNPCRGDRPMILHEALHSTPNATSIVVLLDRDARLEPSPQTLQRMFGLTCAETQLALRMSRGDSPLEIARSRRLSRTTIRSQLASLFAKTETNRQAELVALLCRVAVLP